MVEKAKHIRMYELSQEWGISTALDSRICIHGFETLAEQARQLDYVLYRSSTACKDGFGHTADGYHRRLILGDKPTQFELIDALKEFEFLHPTDQLYQTLAYFNFWFRDLLQLEFPDTIEGNLTNEGYEELRLIDQSIIEQTFALIDQHTSPEEAIAIKFAKLAYPPQPINADFTWAEAYAEIGRTICQIPERNIQSFNPAALRHRVAAELEPYLRSALPKLRDVISIDDVPSFIENYQPANRQRFVTRHAALFTGETKPWLQLAL